MKPAKTERSPTNGPPATPRKAASRDAASDYHAKTTHEADRLSRLAKKAGRPVPLGDASSGVMLAVEPPVGPRLLDALTRSLESVGLSQAYVTWTDTGHLLEEILALEPDALVAVGPVAAQNLDALDYPLVRNLFSEAREGEWFSWTIGTAGLRLPPLAPALEDEAAKRRFWRAFLSLKRLTRAS